jgi:hypothetical protein
VVAHLEVTHSGSYFKNYPRALVPENHRHERISDRTRSDVIVGMAQTRVVELHENLVGTRLISNFDIFDFPLLARFVDHRCASLHDVISSTAPKLL